MNRDDDFEDLIVTVPSIALRPPADDDPSDVLHNFHARVQVDEDGDEIVTIGSITGFVTASHWSVDDHDLADAGDRYDGDAQQLGQVADRIIDSVESFDIAAALLVTCISLNEAFRGRRLTGEIVAQVLNILGLRPDWTLVVLRPEPMTPTGPLDPGVERDTALSTLRAAYYEQGFQSWADGVVWWLPLKEQGGTDVVKSLC